VPDEPQRKLQSLAGRTIVITRARAQASDFVALLENLGARVLLCPMIEIAAPESYAALDEAIDHLYGYDWIVFTSVNGVEYFLRRLEAGGHQPSELDRVRICAIGEATAEKLHDAQVHVDVIPDEFKAEEVFAALERYAGSREALSGVNFLIPRAAVARDYLPEALAAAGARVDVVIARCSRPVSIAGASVRCLQAAAQTALLSRAPRRSEIWLCCLTPVTLAQFSPALPSPASAISPRGPRGNMA
jgi:uroporphyrinogen-III synthase